MKREINIIVLILVLIVSNSCGEVYKTTFANRNLFIFSNDIPKEREYFMTLEMRKEIWKYNYENDEDSEKNMNFIYDLESDILKFGISEFKPINGTEFKVEELSEHLFKKYELTEPIVDGTGPILFNQKYGVLAIGNVMSPDFVYLPRKKDKIMAEKIHKKLTE